MTRIQDKYISPFTDFGFKKLFGTEPNKDLLIDFLNELLRKDEGEIVDLTFLSKEQLGRAIDAEYAEYEESLKYYRDLNNSIDTAFDEGKIEGEIEGERKNKITTAIAMLKKGFSIEDIADVTELSIGEINRLNKDD